MCSEKTITPEKVLLGFARSEKSFSEYCEERGITPSEYIELICEAKVETETLLYSAISKCKLKSTECSDDEIVSIAAAMLNGVESNDSSAMRHFYLFDYYTKTNMPFDDFVKRLDGLKERILDEATSQVTNGKSVLLGNDDYQKALTTANAADILVRNIKIKCGRMSTNINYNARFLVSNVLNENTIIRKNGEDRKVTREEKIDALVWMMEHGLPNCVSLYKSVVRGIVDGHIKVGDTQNVVEQTMGKPLEFVKTKPSSLIGSTPANT